MKFAVAIFTWNRPHMFDLSLKHLAECRGAQHIPIHVYLDGGRTSESEIQNIIDKYKDKFAATSLTCRPVNWGLTRNILISVQETFARGYDVVCLLEDDVLCSKDFLEYHKRCHTTLDFEKLNLLAIAGYTKEGPKAADGMNPAEAIFLQQWYTPDGVSFRRNEWNLVEERMKDYLRDPIGTLNSMKDAVIKAEPQRQDMWVGNMPKYVAQAGYIQRIRAARGMKIVCPCMSRCQDIGFYGTHEPSGLKVYTGIDPYDKENWKRSHWYTDRFQEDYQWKELRFI